MPLFVLRRAFLLVFGILFVLIMVLASAVSAAVPVPQYVSMTPPPFESTETPVVATSVTAVVSATPIPATPTPPPDVVTSTARLDAVSQLQIENVALPPLAPPWTAPVLLPPAPPILPTRPITVPVVLNPGEWREPDLPYVAPTVPADLAAPSVRTYDASGLATLPRLTTATGTHTPGQGGSVVAGSVRLAFAAGTHGRSLQVRLGTGTSYPLMRSGIRPYLLFTVDLTDSARGDAVHAIDNPSELRVNLASVPGALAASANLGLYHYDETARAWEKLTSRREGDELVAEVSRFSSYGIGGDFGHDWQPSASAQAGAVQLFAGAASFAVPLAVPQGTAGRAPSLSLVYAGQAPDQINDVLAGPDGPGDNQSPRAQADWVGLGWSLGVGRITSVVPDLASTAPPEYSIELNGTSERLICISTSGCTSNTTATLEYKTERDSFLRIIRKTGGPTSQSYPSDRNLEGFGIYFQVWDRSGTYYRFGYNWDAEHLRGNQNHLSAWGFSIDLMEDASGNRMEWEYFEDQGQLTGDARPFSRAAYPARIKYTFNTAGFGSGSTFGTHYHREVRFNESRWVSGNPRDWGTTNRTDWSNGSDSTKYYYLIRYRLDDVTSYLKVASLSSSEQPFRKYTFTYDYATPTWQNYTPAQSKLRLKEVREYAGASFATTLYSGDPTYTFSYGTARLHLTQIQTALGGSVTYDYQTFTTDSTDLDSSFLTRYRVTNLSLSPGTGLDPAVTTAYTYGTARYDETGRSFLGHDWTQATDAAGHAVVHYFFLRQM